MGSTGETWNTCTNVIMMATFLETREEAYNKIIPVAFREYIMVHGGGVTGSSSGSYPLAGFCISDVKRLGPTTTYYDSVGQLTDHSSNRRP
jgi:hypothetical protein